MTRATTSETGGREWRVVEGHNPTEILAQGLSEERARLMAARTVGLRAHLRVQSRVVGEWEDANHAFYAHPVDGGWAGYRGGCHDCAYVGDTHTGSGAKDQARQDAAAAHGVEIDA